MKKLLAIMMAMVMVLALTVAVAADDPAYYAEYKDVTNAWEVVYNTAEDTVLTDVLDAIGDDAIITFAMSSASDWSVFSYAELSIQDNAQTGWPGNEWGNCTYVNARYETDTVTVTYGQLKTDLAVGGWDIHDVKFAVNSDASAPITFTITVVDPNPEAPAEEPEAAEDETPAEEVGEVVEDTAPAEDAPAAAPATGIAFAVVPAIVAMAAVAVSKKR